MTTEPDHRDQVQYEISKPFKFVIDEKKTEGWQSEELANSYERMMINYLLSSNVVILVLKPKLIDKI